MTIAEALKLGSELLSEESIPSPGREASLLLRYVLKCDAAFVYAHPDHRLNAMESILFKAVINRRAAHEPYQYIVGKQEFFGLEFEVTSDVLIPRPETEILVENAIDEYKKKGPFCFCDIGIGSGCIAISMLANLAKATAVGVDASDAAIDVAAHNARTLGVADRLDLVQGNVFDAVDGQTFDLIVSNPPYVPEADLGSLQPEVKSFEPRIALTGGEDGLNIVRKLIVDSAKHLNPRGLLYIEIGWNQSEQVREVFADALWKSVEFLPDLQGIPRIVKSTLK